MPSRLTIAIALLVARWRARGVRLWALARPWRRRAAERAELAALRVVVNELVARVVSAEARLDAHALQNAQLVQTLQPVLQGHGVQLLDHAWWLSALRKVGSTHRCAEIERLHDEAKAEWAARNVPAAAEETSSAPTRDDPAATAALDDLAIVPQEARG